MYKKQKNFEVKKEAKRINKHANNRIIYLPPFWNKLYVETKVKRKRASKYVRKSNLLDYF